MLVQQQSYKYVIKEIQDTLDATGQWPFEDYPQLDDALSKLGKHVGCPFHGGTDGFRFFKDGRDANRKTPAVAICNTCGSFTPTNLILKLEGKDKLDTDLIEHLAKAAGMAPNSKPISKPVPVKTQPTKEKAKLSGSEYPLSAWKRSQPVVDQGITYLNSRGIGAIAEKMPDDIRYLPDEKFITGGQTVYKGPCIVSRFSYPDGSLAGINRIFLTPEGDKAVIKDDNGKAIKPKPMAGFRNGRDTPLNGSAVRMPGTGQIEHTGEGIETMLPIRLLFPESVNACGTANIMKRWEPKPETTGSLIWADRDKSGTGEEAAEILAENLKAKGIPAHILLPPGDIPEDEKSLDWLDLHNQKDGDEIIKRAYIEGIDALSVVADELKKFPVMKVQNSPKESYHQSLEQPYLALGYDGENIYIMTRDNRQVRTISYKSLSNKALLLSVASYDYWIQAYSKYNNQGRITGPDYEQCMNQLIRQCTEVGVFNPNVTRGIGFTNDDGRLVRHIGDKLIVDGKATSLFGFESEYTYEKTYRLSVNDYPSLTIEEAGKMEEACALPFWKKPASGSILFLGWCASAAFCGASNWRSHLWITAPAGTGKSTWLIPIMDLLIGRPNMEKFDHVSTEAGIRQTLKHDAKPVIMEEAEADDPESRRRLNRIIQYSRNCSTDNDIQTAKGSPAGSAITYSGRSMFAYISTKDSLEFSADKSRTCCIELEREKDLSEVDRRAKELAELLAVFDRECYSERLIAFVSANWKMLQKNISVLSLEAARQLRSHRHGDQYGTLLAAYWTVAKQTEISEEEATTLVVSLDLNSMTEDQDEQSDEQRCLDLIMALDIRVEVFRTHTTTIREAIRALAGHDDDLLKVIGSGDEHADSVDEGKKALKRVLRRHGIVYQADDEELHGCIGQGVYIANTCQYLKTRMEKTAFPKWSKMLIRLDKAKPLPKDKYLKVCGKSGKAVFIEM